MSEETIAYILFVVGVLGSIFIPYVLEWADRRVKFDYRYLIGRVLGSVIAIIPFLAGMVETLSTLDPVGAFVYGWFASEIGRQGQKAYRLVRS